MKRAIAIQTLPGGHGEKIAAAARAGFDGIEIFENDLLHFDRRSAEVRNMCRDIGLEIVS
jgi:4-hydroxyphenylpyruvate dioxygenase